MEKYKRTYVEPEIKLISSEDQDLGMYLWLQSRNKILSNLDGTSLEVDPTLKNFTPGFKFKVGNEVVEYSEYKTRINNLNLQYNNSVYYLFEIKGSCLFRDMCYNINTTSQWAESNRFLFSILDETARLNSELYPISGEYKGIQSWEDQFDKYMDTIHKDPIVDHNRLEMPYSISSRFWWGVTRAQLRYFIEFLKFHSPFFYDIYGTKLIDLTGLDSNNLSSEINPMTSQYLIKDRTKWKPRIETLEGTVVINLKMGLILYSQFIRQSGAVIKGYLDNMIHSRDELDNFQSRVFKGDTILDVTCVISEDKLKKTLSNRSCAFAMSSGNSPCSWNSLIEMYVSSMNLEEFKEFLPCKFHNYEVVDCKFYDDVKFRNEGKEISNIPCPLVTRSIDDAVAKMKRDDNDLSNRFYVLTEMQNYGGLTLEYTGYHWTSILDLYSERRLNLNKLTQIQKLLNSIENNYDNKISLETLVNSEFVHLLYDSELEFIEKMIQDRDDYTCIMKGFMLDHIRSVYSDMNLMISFGGDIFTSVPQQIKIKDTKFSIKVPANTSVFTSSNTGSRGAHIDTNLDVNVSCTVVVTWTQDVVNNLRDKNWLVDLLATKIVAGDPNVKYIINAIKYLSSSIHILLFDDQNRLINKTYCASPFFNSDQVEIRDNMVSQFLDPFRPDLTASSIKYDNGDDLAVHEVVDDNVTGIRQCEFTVFPNRTLDLGTLYEVGYTIGIGNPVIKYDEKSDSYTILLNLKPDEFDESKSYIFKCSKKSGCIELGMAASMIDNGKKLDIAYTLEGSKDNIMLSDRHKHVELIDNKYVTIERSLDERDE